MQKTCHFESRNNTVIATTMAGVRSGLPDARQLQQGLDLRG
jgi:hypothetical protein